MSDLRSTMNDIVTDRVRATRLQGQHFEVPAPQEGLFAARSTRAQGSRVQWARVGTFPYLGNDDGLQGAPSLLTQYVRSLTEGGGGEFVSSGGGPTPNPHKQDLVKTPNPYLVTG